MVTKISRPAIVSAACSTALTQLNRYRGRKDNPRLQHGTDANIAAVVCQLPELRVIGLPAHM